MKKFLITCALVPSLLTLANVADYYLTNHDLGSTVNMSLGTFVGGFCLALTLYLTKQIKGS